MTELVFWAVDRRLILWGRLHGTVGALEWRGLAAALGRLRPCEDCQVVLDFSRAEHLDFRAVPMLIDIGAELERRGGELRIAGLSSYLRRIVELGGALEGREFVEAHMWVDSALPDPAEPGPGIRAWRPWSAPQDLLVSSRN